MLFDKSKKNRYCVQFTIEICDAMINKFKNSIGSAEPPSEAKLFFFFYKLWYVFQGDLIHEFSLIFLEWTLKLKLNIKTEIGRKYLGKLRPSTTDLLNKKLRIRDI